jgi:trehalose/maltose hydrolase-like predicted phosphorylase
MTEPNRAVSNAWNLTFDEWKPEDQPLREALCTLGNGYLATRGAAEENDAGGPHYPGTYLAGGYNRLESEVAGQIIENEDLVNWPNWLCLSFRVEGGDWFAIDQANLLHFQQTLDLKNGVLTRHLRFRHADGRETSLLSRRLVHMRNPHLAAVEWTLTSENWSGAIEVSSRLDGTISNQGVRRYRALKSQHLERLDAGHVGEDGVYLTVQSNQSLIRMTQAARTRAFADEQYASLERTTRMGNGSIEQHLFLECRRGRPLRIEKVVGIHCSHDFAISEPALSAKKEIRRAGNFKELFASHSLAWQQLWNRADIELADGDAWSQRVLRLHIFHLLQTTSINSIDRDIGVPSRGWHGEAYRGHIFWDEIYIFPFLNLRIPELTRSLLMYRYRRLNEARSMAAEAGYRGAMYPWQSGSSGREESQVLHLNPKSGRWIPDNTFRQRHINGAIAYNVWQHFQATGDIDFLSRHGAEMLLEIARFWSSLVAFNPERSRYEIRGVVGPDEFHTEYPNSGAQGLNNNAYTNVLAAWVLYCARKAVDLLAEDRQRELLEQLQITDEELNRWEEISRKMFVPFHDDGIISQFEGYEKLEEFDWEGYRQKYGDIQRLDRILDAEGDSPSRYKASKQADVLMLFYLFSSDQLRDILERLDYSVEPDLIPRNIDYYMARTSHGSTLSRVVHSWVLARSDRERSWELFGEALKSDLSDIQGGTTPEGIHLGAMAGTVDIIQRCYTGIEMREESLYLNPCLPDQLHEIRLRIRYRGHWLRLQVTHEKLTVSSERSWSGPAKVHCRDEIHTFKEEGEEMTFTL